ncbi:anti-sigma factor [Streptomyces sp. NPDC047065]|uniref:anti-sigma factor n=1 Tax=Streptomyces sp. NPDC047065 TaxID=3154606 RepID=UPI0034069D40
MRDGDDDPHLDLGAYVLHALPATEEAAFENHLATCVDCQRETAELSNRVSLLGSSETRTPPLELRRRVLELIVVVRQEQPGRPEPHGPEQRQETQGSAAARQERGHRPRRRILGLALAASLAATASLGGVAWWQHSEAESARQEAAAARTGSEALAEVLAAPDATISTTGLPSGASASVIASRAQGQAAFVASGLPPLTGDRVYELWYEDDGAFRPAGLLAGAGGRLAHILEGPLGARNTIMVRHGLALLGVVPCCYCYLALIGACCSRLRRAPGCRILAVVDLLLRGRVGVARGG